MNTTLTSLLIVLLFIWTGTALAKPELSIELAAEKEIIEVVDGERTVTRVPASDIEPGQEILYTLTYRNSGDETATNARLNDPIPEGTSYITGSAFGEGSEITFSIDGGKSFKKPALLTYETQNEDGSMATHQVSPESYTHIQWLVKSIPAGSSGRVGFKVLVK